MARISFGVSFGWIFAASSRIQPPEHAMQSSPHASLRSRAASRGVLRNAAGPGTVLRSAPETQPGSADHNRKIAARFYLLKFLSRQPRIPRP